MPTGSKEDASVQTPGAHRRIGHQLFAVFLHPRGSARRRFPMIESSRHTRSPPWILEVSGSRGSEKRSEPVCHHLQQNTARITEPAADASTCASAARYGTATAELHRDAKERKAQKDPPLSD